MSYLPQTNRIRRALLAAGYTKDQFSVNTPHSKKYGGYIETRIRIRTRDSYQDQFIQKVLDTKEIDVERIEFHFEDGTPYHYFSYTPGHGIYTTRNIDPK